MTDLSIEHLDARSPTPMSALASPDAPYQVNNQMNRFCDEDADGVTHCKLDWLIKNALPRRGVGFLPGPSGSGKSFWMLSTCSHVAKGWEVLGRRTLQSGVVYIAAEGANGVRARIEGLRMRDGGWEGWLRFISDAPRLNDEADVVCLRAALKRIRQEMEEAGIRLGLVVIDTLSASTPGADENTAKDMGPVMQALQDMSAALDAFIMVVAHIGKEAERGIRGWSGLFANADAVINISPPGDDGIRSGLLAKVKDAEAGERFAFKLDAVELGFDRDGDSITTCVAVECDPPARKSSKSRVQGLSAPVELVLRAIDRLDDQAVDVSHLESTVRGQRGTALTLLREKAYEMGLQAETKPDRDEDAEYRRWCGARKKAFQRAVHKLMELRKIRQEEDYVWRLGE